MNTEEKVAGGSLSQKIERRLINLAGNLNSKDQIPCCRKVIFIGVKQSHESSDDRKRINCFIRMKKQARSGSKDCPAVLVVNLTAFVIKCTSSIE